MKLKDLFESTTHEVPVGRHQKFTLKDVLMDVNRKSLGKWTGLEKPNLKKGKGMGSEHGPGPLLADDIKHSKGMKSVPTSKIMKNINNQHAGKGIWKGMKTPIFAGVGTPGAAPTSGPGVTVGGSSGTGSAGGSPGGGSAGGGSTGGGGAAGGGA